MARECIAMTPGTPIDPGGYQLASPYAVSWGRLADAVPRTLPRQSLGRSPCRFALRHWLVIVLVVLARYSRRRTEVDIVVRSDRDLRGGLRDRTAAAPPPTSTPLAKGFVSQRPSCLVGLTSGRG
jgi:hypothetical protein